MPSRNKGHTTHLQGYPQVLAPAGRVPHPLDHVVGLPGPPLLVAQRRPGEEVRPPDARGAVRGRVGGGAVGQHGDGEAGVAGGGGGRIGHVVAYGKPDLYWNRKGVFKKVLQKWQQLKRELQTSNGEKCLKLTQKSCTAPCHRKIACS